MQRAECRKKLFREEEDLANEMQLFLKFTAAFAVIGGVQRESEEWNCEGLQTVQCSGLVEED